MALAFSRRCGARCAGRNGGATHMSRVTSLNPFVGLGRYLLALLLLAGVPAVADARAQEAGLRLLSESLGPAVGRDESGRARAIAAAAERPDAEDGPDPLALLISRPDIASAPLALLTAARACAATAPPSHWPCAGPARAPPSAE
jgi:hypothetical protein